jgi:hypothetical protein
MSEPARTETLPRRRLRLRLAIGAAVVCLGAAGAALWRASQDDDPVDAPVASSELDGFPARGSLIESGDWAAEVEEAADVWRDEPSGGREEPPARTASIEVLWAGDLPADTWTFDLRYELVLHDPDGSLPEAARAVVLRAGEQTALLVAAVDDQGDRDDDFTVVGDGVAPYLDGAALLPGDGVLLLAATPDAEQPTSVDLAFPGTGTRGAANDASARPLHDGLLLGAGSGALRWPSPDGSTSRLVATSSGETMDTEDDALWAALTGTDPRTTWAALRDAGEAAAERDPDSPALVDLWGTEDLDDGRSAAAVGALAGGRYATDWWAVSASILPAGATDDTEPWTWGLGRGTPAIEASVDGDLPPLGGGWVVRDAGELTVDLVVAAPPDVASVEVVTQDRTVELPSGLSVIPAWERTGDPPTSSPVVLVGRDAEGRPLSPLPR